MARFFDEVRRRRVLQGLAGYLVGAWVVVEVTDVVGPAIGLPPRALSWMVATAAVGIIPAVLISWAYDFRSGRLVRTAAVVPADGGTRRVAVLPFRLLRIEPDLDYLSIALPDAVAGGLAADPGLTVDTSLLQEKQPLSEDEAATRVGAHVVLTGTIVREGSEIQVRPQLRSVIDRRVLWSGRIQMPAASLFQLQDRVSADVARALAGNRGGRRTAPSGLDVPENPRAYELYLRSNQLAVQSGRWTDAVALYQACLEEDPNFAPAWARMGRCQRLIAKWTPDPVGSRELLEEAERSLRRALELNAELPIAHSYYAQLELDLGRAEDSMVRLLARVASVGEHPDLLAGLVQACRFCGLLDESVAAWRRARALDPHVRTSVAHTFFMRGDYEAALLEYNNADIGYMQGVALAMLGRREEAIALLAAREQERAGTALADYLGSLRFLLDGRRDESLCSIELLLETELGHDGEAVYYIMRQLVQLAEVDRALGSFRRVIQLGFVCTPAFANDPWLNALRTRPEFGGLYRLAELRTRQARAAWLETGGEGITAQAGEPA
jgi:eukaryotic-like serine/threonine-protein kinase